MNKGFSLFKSKIKTLNLVFAVLLVCSGCQQMKSDISEIDKTVANNELNKKELEEKVDKLLNEGDNAALRRNIEDVFKLGDIYIC